MKRRTIHLYFGAATLCLAVFAASQCIALRHAQKLAALVAAPETIVPQDPPEARLARARALASRGISDEAAATYNALIDHGKLNAIGGTALFNLGNMYLRGGMAVAQTEPARSAPLIELAKRHYRELLAAHPDDWDARYNLERALRLRPETEASFIGQGQIPSPIKRVGQLAETDAPLP